MENRLFKLTDVTFSYMSKDTKSSDFTLCVDEMNIYRGKVTIIVGRSGCGKTTLLSILGLLRKPETGSLELFFAAENDHPLISSDIWQNEDLVESLRRTFLGFALQGGELLSYLTVQENIELALKLAHKEFKSSEKQVVNMLDRLFKSDERNIYQKIPEKLSQGQYHRSALVRAIIHEPLVVLADEPTGNLDIVNGKNVLMHLKEYVRQHKDRAVILVTHDFDHALDFADEIFVLNNGRIIGNHRPDADGRWPDIAMIKQQISYTENEDMSEK